MSSIEEESRKKNDEELPPFFRTWKQMYIAVLVNLVLTIILFYGFTKLFE
jgi:hypothetical protein